MKCILTYGCGYFALSLLFLVAACKYWQVCRQISLQYRYISTSDIGCLNYLFILFIYLCQTQQRSIVTRKTKTHKQIYQAQHKA